MGSVMLALTWYYARPDVNLYGYVDWEAWGDGIREGWITTDGKWYR